jgi:hypothetical protein
MSASLIKSASTQPEKPKDLKPNQKNQNRIDQQAQSLKSVGTLAVQDRLLNELDQSMSQTIEPVLEKTVNQPSVQVKAQPQTQPQAQPQAQSKNLVIDELKNRQTPSIEALVQQKDPRMERLAQREMLKNQASSSMPKSTDMPLSPKIEEITLKPLSAAIESLGQYDFHQQAQDELPQMAFKLVQIRPARKPTPLKKKNKKKDINHPKVHDAVFDQSQSDQSQFDQSQFDQSQFDQSQFDQSQSELSQETNEIELQQEPLIDFIDPLSPEDAQASEINVSAIELKDDFRELINLAKVNQVKETSIPSELKFVTDIDQQTHALLPFNLSDDQMTSVSEDFSLDLLSGQLHSDLQAKELKEQLASPIHDLWIEMNVRQQQQQAIDFSELEEIEELGESQVMTWQEYQNKKSS